MNTKAKQMAVMGGTLLLAVLGAFAKPGEGIKVGNLKLSPFLDAAITYDSNVFLEGSNEKDDFYLDLVGGVGFLNKTDRMSLLGRGWFQYRWYDEYDIRDAEGFGEKLGLIWGDLENLLLEVNQKFVRLSDYELTPRSVDTLNTLSQNLLLTEDRTERVNRDLFDIGAVLGRYLTDKLEADVGLGFNAVEYDPDFESDEGVLSDVVLGPGSLSVNTNGLFDWYEIRGQAELTHQLSDKTSALLTGQFSQQTSDGFEEDSTLYLVRVGLLTYATKKVSIKGGAGFETYDFGGKSEYGDDLDVTIFNFDVSGSWQATEKLMFEISGRNGIQPATQYRANIKEVTLAQLGAIYDITTRLNVSLAGSYRFDDYVGRIQLLDESLVYKEKEHFGGRLRLNYKPKSPWFDLYAEGTYEDANDSLNDDYIDYEQWRITAGVALRY